MVKKIIRFDMYIKTSEQTPTYSYVAKQKVMSNDKDSTQITFNLLDVSPDELSGSSASILLYMQDGSFFQSSDVTIDKNSVIYTMKQEETKHSGNTKVQIVLKKGTVQTASLIYNFEIEKGLEKYPITEVMIQDWTTLTEEAKAFVEQIEGFTLEQFVENKMGQELANLEVNYATRLTGLEQKDNQLTAQLAQKANASDLISQTSRIDNLIALPDGSTTNDARVEDIRIGFNGFLYDSPGSSVREQIKSLHNFKDSISKIGKNRLNPNDKDVRWGQKFTSGTYMVPDETKSVTGFIKVVQGETITLSVDKVATSWANKAAFDDSMSSIDTLYSGFGNRYTVPEGVAFLRFTIGTSVMESDKVQIEASYDPTEFEPFGYTLKAHNLDSLADKIDEDVESLNSFEQKITSPSKNIFDFNSDDIKTNSYITAAGTVRAGGGIVTGFMRVEPGSKLWTSIDGRSINISQCAVYDSKKELIEIVSQVGDAYVIPENAYFVRMVSSSSYNLGFANPYAQVEMGDGVTPFEEHGVNIKGINFLGKVNGENPLPDYILEEKNRVEDMLINTKSIFNFAFATDIHENTYDHYKVKQVAELDELGLLDVIIDGGDLIEGAVPQQEAVKILKSATKEYLKSNHDIIMTRGNHDANFSADTDGGTEGVPTHVWHNVTCSHQNGEAVFDEFAPLGGYYYKDYPKAKIRIINMNTSDVFDDNGEKLTNPMFSDVRQKQFSWFCDHALNFMDKGTDRSNWGVIIVSHLSLVGASGTIDWNPKFPYDDTVLRNRTNFEGVIKAFIEGGKFSLTTNLGNDFQLMSNVDYAEQGAMEFMFGLSGHSHWDVVANQPEINNKIWVKTANMKRAQNYRYDGENDTPLYPIEGGIYDLVVPYRGEVDSRKSDGMIHSELMDIFTIDRESKVLKAIRYGAGADRIIPY